VLRPIRLETLSYGLANSLGPCGVRRFASACRILHHLWLEFVRISSVVHGAKRLLICGVVGSIPTRLTIFRQPRSEGRGRMRSANVRLRSISRRKWPAVRAITFRFVYRSERCRESRVPEFQRRAHAARVRSERTSLSNAASTPSISLPIDVIDRLGCRPQGMPRDFGCARRAK
jgi:hypothetical protein